MIIFVNKINNELLNRTINYYLYGSFNGGIGMYQSLRIGENYNNVKELFLLTIY